MNPAKRSPNNLFPHGRWLLCAPEHFDVKYEINPWMDIKITPESELAAQQWRDLHHTLIRLGAYIEYVDGTMKVPDLVYTANGGLVKGQKVILSTFKHPERQREQPIFREWFESHGLEVLTLSKGSFEGEGDALFAGEMLFCGYGFRSDKEVYDEVKEMLEVEEVVLCELTDSRYYHIDTCFCPLDENNALINSTAFTEESVKKMREKITLHEVSDDDAKQFVCNAVVLGKNVVLPTNCESTYRLLESLSYTPYPVEMTEFMKGGGASKCLSLQLDRT